MAELPGEQRFWADLTVDEVREVTNMARRIAAILLLEPALDENYEKVKSSTYKWERSAKS